MMFDKTGFLTQVNNIRRQNRKALSNYYLTPIELAVVAQEQDSELLFNDNAVVVARNDNGVSRVYFYLVDGCKKEYLKKLLDILKIERPYVAEYVVKGEISQEIVAIFEFCGLKSYKEMWRLSAEKIKLPFKVNNRELEMAKAEDAQEISDLFYKVFDPLESHLPTVEQIAEEAKQDLVTCVRMDNKIVAVSMLEWMNDKTLYSWQTACLPEYQGSGVGVLVYLYAFSKYLTVDNYVSWVRCDNLPSIRMQKSLGFKFDGIRTYIFVKE